MKTYLALIALCLSGCVMPGDAPTSVPPTGAPLSVAADMAARNFVTVVQRVEPVAEQACRSRTAGVNCDFIIAVDDDPRAEANAFQTIDDVGRPYIVFTLPLIADARNPDELAFILGHEAAHHIEGHIPKQQQSALTGALIFGALAAANGASDAGQARAQEIGAALGARAFSKDMELEADALGTVIAAQAGFDPVLGARYFQRIEDPGDAFLGTHPPNAAREQVVAKVAAGL